jgi:hypothetical protein
VCREGLLIFGAKSSSARPNRLLVDRCIVKPLLVTQVCVNPYSRPPSCLERVESDGAAALGSTGFLGTEPSLGCRPTRFGAAVCGARVRHLGASRCSRTIHAVAPTSPTCPTLKRVCSSVAAATRRCLAGRLPFLRHPSACRVDRRQESVSFGPPLLGLEGRDEQ